ncbi:MAG: hypothetical protein U9R75_09335 [Candidatus Thermoplasmatota archaeon]|nr:hypothetical protein [Candidatus Thermoplasmatota archaeon]
MSFDFAPGGKYQPVAVTVNVQISRVTRYSTGPNPLVNLTVEGEWYSKYDAGSVRTSGVIEPYPLYVNVKPFHYLTMSFDPPMMQIMPGSSGYIDCIILNQGNGYERVELIMPGELAYAKSGWVIEMEETVLNIDPTSEVRTRIKITSPRGFQFKWHRTMISFPMFALSHYSKYQVQDMDLEYEYQSQTYDIQVQMSGFDFVYVPYMWALVFWLAIALVLFNIGINPLVMRKRNLPPGKDPGFIALYHFSNSLERRDRWRQKQARKRKRRLEMKEERSAGKLKLKEEKEHLKKIEAQRKKASASKELDLSKKKPMGTSPRVLDLKRSDDDFDIEIPGEEPPTRGKARPLFSHGPSKPGKKSMEHDMLDVLEHLDD